MIGPMPLARIKKDGEFDYRRQAIGFWMIIEPIEIRPFRPVRVYITSETLAKIDPSQPTNPTVSLEIFSHHRSSIEAAASTAFDIHGVDEGDFGGKPIVTVRSEDLPLNDN
jgi:hypothetical protein